jgi:hypothetical protein
MPGVFPKARLTTAAGMPNTMSASRIAASHSAVVLCVGFCSFAPAQQPNGLALQRRVRARGFRREYQRSAPDDEQFGRDSASDSSVCKRLLYGVGAAEPSKRPPCEAENNVGDDSDGYRPSSSEEEQGSPSDPSLIMELTLRVVIPRRGYSKAGGSEAAQRRGQSDCSKRTGILVSPHSGRPMPYNGSAFSGQQQR